MLETSVRPELVAEISGREHSGENSRDSECSDIGAGRIAAIEGRSRRVEIALEPWDKIGSEFLALGLRHFEEVDGGVEPKRKVNPVSDLFALMDAIGTQKIWGARIDGELVGYLAWSIEPDAECGGVLIAKMGPWFVSPDCPDRRAALMLWNRSIAELRLMGVQCAYPHHRLQGRGANLGNFFKRQGAKEIQVTYSMWIGE